MFCTVAVKRLLLPGLRPASQPQSIPTINTAQQYVPVVLSLVCPLSQRRISLPVRGRACQHVQVKNLLLFQEINCYYFC